MIIWVSFGIAVMTLAIAVEFIFNKPDKDGTSSSNND